MDAVRGIIAAILAIRDRDAEVGKRVATRWRRLVAGLTRDNTQPWPEAGSELSWLADDVARTAPPESLPAIHSALRNWGWEPDEQESSDPVAHPASSARRDQAQDLLSALTSTVNDIAAQLRVYREEAQGFERLPARIQDLLTRGLVIDHTIENLENAPGVSVVDLIVVNESESSIALRKDVRDATQRWAAILKLARHIFDNVAPDRDLWEIENAVEHVLNARESSEVEKLRQQARLGQPGAMCELGKRLMKMGRRDEAEKWLRDAAEARHPGALFTLGKLAYQDGRVSEADLWLRHAATTGHAEAMFDLWRLNQDRGRPDEAQEWLHRAAEAGYPEAQVRLWRQNQESGRADEAREWLHRAADAGHRDALIHQAKMIDEEGRPAEAEGLLLRAMAGGGSGAMFDYERMLYEKQRRKNSSAEVTH